MNAWRAGSVWLHSCTVGQVVSLSCQLASLSDPWYLQNTHCHHWPARLHHLHIGWLTTGWPNLGQHTCSDECITPSGWWWDARASQRMWGNYISLPASISYGGRQTAGTPHMHAPSDWLKPPDSWKPCSHTIQSGSHQQAVPTPQLCSCCRLYELCMFSYVHFYFPLQHCYQPVSPITPPRCTVNMPTSLMHCTTSTAIWRSYSRTASSLLWHSTAAHTLSLWNMLIAPTFIPYGLCAICALGSYNPIEGGHIILFNLGLVIQFPPSSIMLISSSTICHGNVRIKPHEMRQSFTQYYSGGLLWWVAYGFKAVKSCKVDIKHHFEEIHNQHHVNVLGLFSKLHELHHDRVQVFAFKGSC